MKSVMSITNNGSWTIELTAETPTEAQMIDAASKGYGMTVECYGDREQLKIVGRSTESSK
jgi:uncharacterized protein YfiM (DUF2279 family)